MLILLLYLGGVVSIFFLNKFFKKSWLAYSVLGIEVTIIGGTLIVAYGGDNIGYGCILIGLIFTSCGFLLNNTKK